MFMRRARSDAAIRRVAGPRGRPARQRRTAAESIHQRGMPGIRTRVSSSTPTRAVALRRIGAGPRPISHLARPRRTARSARCGTCARHGGASCRAAPAWAQTVMVIIAGGGSSVTQGAGGLPALHFHGGRGAPVHSLSARRGPDVPGAARRLCVAQGLGAPRCERTRAARAA